MPDTTVPNILNALAIPDTPGVLFNAASNLLQNHYGWGGMFLSNKLSEEIFHELRAEFQLNVHLLTEAGEATTITQIAELLAEHGFDASYLLTRARTDGYSYLFDNNFVDLNKRLRDAAANIENFPSQVTIPTNYIYVSDSAPYPTAEREANFDLRKIYNSFQQYYNTLCRFNAALEGSYRRNEPALEEVVTTWLPRIKQALSLLFDTSEQQYGYLKKQCPQDGSADRALEVITKMEDHIRQHAEAMLHLSIGAIPTPDNEHRFDTDKKIQLAIVEAFVNDISYQFIKMLEKSKFTYQDGKLLCPPFEITVKEALDYFVKYHPKQLRAAKTKLETLQQEKGGFTLREAIEAIHTKEVLGDIIYTFNWEQLIASEGRYQGSVNHRIREFAEAAIMLGFMDQLIARMRSYHGNEQKSPKNLVEDYSPTEGFEKFTTPQKHQNSVEQNLGREYPRLRSLLSSEIYTKFPSYTNTKREELDYSPGLTFLDVLIEYVGKMQQRGPHITAFIEKARALGEELQKLLDLKPAIARPGLEQGYAAAKGR